MAETNEKTKSWSRELAVVLCIGLGVMVYADKTEMVELFIWPVFAFVAGAFLPTKLQQLQSFIITK